MPDIELWKIFASLGIPGIAFGVFYMLFRSFNFSFPRVPKAWVGPIIILFMLLIASIVFYALQQWSPQGNSDKKSTSNIIYNGTIDTIIYPPSLINIDPAIDELIKILDYRAEKIIESFGNDNKEDIENFKKLHIKHKNSLRSNNIILAHEICNDIYNVLYSLKLKQNKIYSGESYYRDIIYTQYVYSSKKQIYYYNILGYLYVLHSEERKELLLEYREYIDILANLLYAK